MSTLISYGKHIYNKAFLIEHEKVGLYFTIFKREKTEWPFFSIELLTKSQQNIYEPELDIYQEINKAYLFITDDTFAKNYKHSYYIIKFLLEDGQSFTIGSYSDALISKPSNTYILSNIGFINILAKGMQITNSDILKETNFDILRSVFNKTELAKALIAM